MGTTAFLYHPVFLKHQTGWKHPENRRRLTAILDHLRKTGLWDQLLHLAPRPASEKDLATIHDLHYVQQLRQTSAAGRLFEPDDVTIGSPGTYDAATMAAGAVLTAIDAVMGGRAANAFCAVRPPGHHAERDHAMGFCFFNNIAIGAKYLQHRYGFRRVAIIDWDVHHGNGTQQAFYNDPSIFYFSIHQYPLYPQSGRACETGDGKGKGFTLNVPMPAGSTDTDYKRVFTGELRPAMDRFLPEFILVSAGFDGHRDDPLASISLTEGGFGELTRIVKDMASDYCGNRVVSVLEGGYTLEALTVSVEEHLRNLLAG